ncbi:hypothetical protein PsAD2_02348 [Pseudovibrio axinellae]|uniref:Uncharacterized protein n=1 Tax=Pseudovibrio axinellae TaxID=989403 RepID=A0A165YGV8_9HYPH|nr:hypothetical protein [Pseudovibrio axinellae]KZL18832.1 hypothetical protein PsAD2_02348 [Pseudovibrio axinellae]SEP91159.1 hypothetical protein SAMN05421798_101693 [Pseudovibrio axinellae]
MYFRLLIIGLLCATTPSLAATQAIQTETIRIQRPKAEQFPLLDEDFNRDTSQEDDLDNEFAEEPPLPKLDIFYDDAGLPEAVKATRDALIKIARSGDVAALAPLFAKQDQSPELSFTPVRDPVSFLKDSSGDGEGHEILAILLDIVTAGYLRVNEGTEEETYVWPYFAHYPLHDLTPSQKVEMYQIVTAADYFEMLDYGAWTFYRLGISKDGDVRSFIAGD